MNTCMHTTKNYSSPHLYIHTSTFSSELFFSDFSCWDGTDEDGVATEGTGMTSEGGGGAGSTSMGTSEPDETGVTMALLLVSDGADVSEFEVGAVPLGVELVDTPAEDAVTVCNGIKIHRLYRNLFENFVNVKHNHSIAGTKKHVKQRQKSITLRRRRERERKVGKD